MRRAAYARLAGATFLLYIAASLPAMVLLDRATRGEDMAGTFASITRDAADLRVVIILSVITCLAAVVLGVALYAVTRTEEEHLALLAMACRLGEGVLNGVWVVLMMFAWLFVRGRLVPAPLAWWGLAASTLLVAGLPLHLAGLISTAATLALWIPMGLFELALGPWLLIKGVPARSGDVR